VIEKAFVER